MELGRQNAHRANSSEEQEIHGDHHTEKGVSGSRSVLYYECTFCKRGFTNAQALGGHMNIHRKDKSKAKPKLPKSKPSPHQTTYMNKELSTSHIPPSTTFSRANLGFGESGFYNTQMCYYSPLAPPSLHPFNPNPNPSELGFHGGEPGFDLGLQIGSSTKYGDREEEIEDADEGGLVDLELRLGRPPRR